MVRNRLNYVPRLILEPCAKKLKQEGRMKREIKIWGLVLLMAFGCALVAQFEVMFLGRDKAESMAFGAILLAAYAISSRVFPR